MQKVQVILLKSPLSQEIDIVMHLIRILPQAKQQLSTASLAYSAH
jgi:hypothetical protein